MTGPRCGFFAEQDILALDADLEPLDAGRGLGQAVSPTGHVRFVGAHATS